MNRNFETHNGNDVEPRKRIENPNQRRPPWRHPVRIYPRGFLPHPEKTPHNDQKGLHGRRTPFILIPYHGRILAVQKHIVLDDIRITVTGHIGPTRAFGIPAEERAGFSDLTVRLEMTSDLTQTKKEDFRQKLIDCCPLCDTIIPSAAPHLCRSCS
jgi:hypothetical protein